MSSVFPYSPKMKYRRNSLGTHGKKAAMILIDTLNDIEDKIHVRINNLTNSTRKNK